MNINFSRFTIKSRNAITRAFTLTKQCQYAEIEPQVLMVAILQESDEMVSYVLNKMRVDKNSFCSAISNSMRLINRRITSEHDFSLSLQLVFRKSIELSSMVGSDMVSLEHIFWALGTVDNPVRTILNSHGVTPEMLRLAINAYIHRGSEIHRAPEVNRIPEIRRTPEVQDNLSSDSDEFESTVTSFVDKLKNIFNSKFFITICVILVILGIISEFNDNSSSNNSQSGSSYSNKETMITCPICGGSGRYNSFDIFKSQMPCTGCGGSGRVASSQAMGIMKMHTPSTPSNQSNSQRNNSSRQLKDCPHCLGSGICKSCDGDGIIENSPYAYSLDPIVCPNCLSKHGVGKGKCKWCHGTGKRK